MDKESGGARHWPALFISAPPPTLDSLLAAFLKTTDCVSFGGGSCTLADAGAANAGQGGCWRGLQVMPA